MCIHTCEGGTQIIKTVSTPVLQEQSSCTASSLNISVTKVRTRPKALLPAGYFRILRKHFKNSNFETQELSALVDSLLFSAPENWWLVLCLDEMKHGSVGRRSCFDLFVQELQRGTFEDTKNIVSAAAELSKAPSIIKYNAGSTALLSCQK